MLCVRQHVRAGHKMADGTRNKSVQYHRRLDRTPEKGFYRRPEEHKRLVVNLRGAIEKARNKVVKMQTKLDEREQEIEELRGVRQSLAIEKHSGYLVNMYNSDDVNEEMRTRLSHPGDPSLGSVDGVDLSPDDDFPSDEASQESDTETSHLYFSLIPVADPDAEVKDGVDFNVKDSIDILKAGNTEPIFDGEDSAGIVTIPSELTEKSQDALRLNASESGNRSHSPMDNGIKRNRHFPLYPDSDEQHQGNLRTNVPPSSVVQQGLNPGENLVLTNAPRIDTAPSSYSPHSRHAIGSQNGLTARSLGEPTLSGEGCQANTFQESRVKGHNLGQNVPNLHSDLGQPGQFQKQYVVTAIAATTHQSEEASKHDGYHCPRCSGQMGTTYQHTIPPDSLEYAGSGKAGSMALLEIRVPSVWYERGRHLDPQIDKARIPDATNVTRNFGLPSDDPYNDAHVIPDKHTQSETDRSPGNKVEGKNELSGSDILDMDTSSSNVALVKMLLAELSQSQHEVMRLTKELRSRETTQQSTHAAATPVGRNEHGINERRVPDFAAEIVDERNDSNKVCSAADEKHGYYLDYSQGKDGNDIDSRIATLIIPNEKAKHGQVLVPQHSQDQISDIENDRTRDEQGVADLKDRLLQEREIAAIEIDAVLKERDHIQNKYRKLKREIIRLQCSDKDLSSTQLLQEMKDQMQAVTHERDYAVAEIRELESEIEMLKVVYNLHKSFSPNNDLQHELNVAIQNYHNYRTTKRTQDSSRLADMEPGTMSAEGKRHSLPKHSSKKNNHTCMHGQSEKEPLKTFESQRKENDEISKAEHSEKERLQRLVNVLRRKLLEHSLED